MNAYLFFNRNLLSGSNKRCRILYGIEAFFAPKEKALELEKKLQKGALAEIMIASNGKATLKNVISE